VTFFLDQDVPDDLAHWLRHRGHAVTYLRDVLPTTSTDSVAWQWACTHGAVFVSFNRNDVLALRPEAEHPGIVILVRRRTPQAEIAATQKLLNGADDQSSYISALFFFCSCLNTPPGQRRGGASKSDG
jgi:hypothetical protein